MSNPGAFPSEVPKHSWLGTLVAKETVLHAKFIPPGESGGQHRQRDQAERCPRMGTDHNIKLSTIIRRDTREHELPTQDGRKQESPAIADTRGTFLENHELAYSPWTGLGRVSALTTKKLLPSSPTTGPGHKNFHPHICQKFLHSCSSADDHFVNIRPRCLPFPLH